MQRDIEDHLAERILFGELKAGEIVVVDAADPGSELPFTFTGNEQSSAPDVPPVEFDGIIDSLGEGTEQSND
jgi:ATP-dependent Clp protease ATP-binding subunit ClpC